MALGGGFDSLILSKKIFKECSCGGSFCIQGSARKGREGLLSTEKTSQVTTVLKYPPEIKKVPDDMIIFSKITV